METKRQLLGKHCKLRKWFLISRIRRRSNTRHCTEFMFLFPEKMTAWHYERVIRIKKVRAKGEEWKRRVNYWAFRHWQSNCACWQMSFWCSAFPKNGVDRAWGLRNAVHFQIRGKTCGIKSKQNHIFLFLLLCFGFFGFGWRAIRPMLLMIGSGVFPPVSKNWYLQVWTVAMSVTLWK